MYKLQDFQNCHHLLNFNWLINDSSFGSQFIKDRATFGQDVHVCI